MSQLHVLRRQVSHLRLQLRHLGLIVRQNSLHLGLEHEHCRLNVRLRSHYLRWLADDEFRSQRRLALKLFVELDLFVDLVWAAWRAGMAALVRLLMRDFAAPNQLLWTSFYVEVSVGCLRPAEVLGKLVCFLFEGLGDSSGRIFAGARYYFAHRDVLLGRMHTQILPVL